MFIQVKQSGLTRQIPETIFSFPREYERCNSSKAARQAIKKPSSAFLKELFKTCPVASLSSCQPSFAWLTASLAGVGSWLGNPELLCRFCFPRTTSHPASEMNGTVRASSLHAFLRKMNSTFLFVTKIWKSVQSYSEKGQRIWGDWNVSCISASTYRPFILLPCSSQLLSAQKILCRTVMFKALKSDRKCWNYTALTGFGFSLELHFFKCFCSWSSYTVLKVKWREK